MRAYDLVTVMSWTTYFEDFSCKAATCLESPPDLDLKDRGGAWDDDNVPSTNDSLNTRGSHQPDVL